MMCTCFIFTLVSSLQHAPSDSTSSDITFDGLSVVKAVSLVKDGKKGLGFTIERGEKTRGSATVLVASVTRGGPAEVEGTLQVGDQILNVDGQKILGYAYDKVKGALVDCHYVYVSVCMCV